MLTALLTTGVLLGYLICAAYIQGLALSWLWLWFAVPLGAPSIGIAHSLGISTLLCLLRPVELSKASVQTDCYNLAAISGMALVFGFVLHWLMY